MDKATTTLERIADARCFAEISAHIPLKKFVWLEVEGEEKTMIDVEYEWVPLTCSKCQCLDILIVNVQLRKLGDQKCT